MPHKKVVLAYSGGLDTSYCIPYLTRELGLEVHAVTVDTGGFQPEQFKALEERALALGAHSFKVVNAVPAYYEQCLRFLIFGNVLRYQTYPLSVSAERMFQALEVAKYAKAIGAGKVAHGSTGAGNDQVRFDLVFRILAPELEIITPIRDQRLSREQEIAYLQKLGFGWTWDRAKYSINQGIWGTSVGGAETLTSSKALPEEAYPTHCTRTQPEDIAIEFERGELHRVNGIHYAHPTEAIKALQTVAGPFAIGRDIHVGDTIIGIKGRVGFEAAAPLIILKAHHLLEKHVLTKWQLYWKEQLANWYGMLVHEGQFLDPVMRNIEAFLTDTQTQVSGTVHVRLHPYRFELLGIESKNDLMNTKFGQYGEMNLAWDGEDVKGFTKIMAIQNTIYYSLHEPLGN